MGYDITPLISKAREKGILEPEKAARFVIGQIPKDRYRDALWAILPHAVTAYYTRCRGEGLQARRRISRNNGESRWKTAFDKLMSEATHAHGRDVWKEFGDLDKVDCYGNRDYYQTEAYAFLAKAQLFDQLAKELTKHKAKIVRELPEAAVRKCFDNMVEDA